MDGTEINLILFTKNVFSEYVQMYQELKKVDIIFFCRGRGRDRKVAL